MTLGRGITVVRCLTLRLALSAVFVSVAVVGAISQGTQYDHAVVNTAPPDAYLSLRSEPSSKSGERLMAMPNGTRLNVLTKRPDGWWLVQVSPTGVQGWALSGAEGKAWIEAIRVPDAAGNSGPSFDCRRASTAREVAICGSAELSQLDRRYGELWRLARPVDVNGEVAVQVGMLYRAGEACVVAIPCLRRTLADGIRYLDRYLRERGIRVAESAPDVNAGLSDTPPSRDVIPPPTQQPTPPSPVTTANSELIYKLTIDIQNARAAADRAVGDAERAKAEYVTARRELDAAKSELADVKTRLESARMAVRLQTERAIGAEERSGNEARAVREKLDTALAALLIVTILSVIALYTALMYRRQAPVVYAEPTAEKLAVGTNSPRETGLSVSGASADIIESASPPLEVKQYAGGKPSPVTHGPLTYWGASIAGLGLLGFVAGELIVWQILSRMRDDPFSAIRAASDGTAENARDTFPC